MKLSELSKEELELMSYDDVAYLILKDETGKMKINDLFKKVCDLLNLSSQEFENRIADFFEMLTTDKRFTMLEDGSWDLKDRHSQKVVIDEDDDDFSDETEEEKDVEEESNIYDDSEEDSDSDDDLKDLVVIDEENDEEEENL